MLSKHTAPKLSWHGPLVTLAEVMNSLGQKMAHVFHHGQSTTNDVDLTSDSDDSDTTTTGHYVAADTEASAPSSSKTKNAKGIRDVRSRTISSCEMFDVFKALAAGKRSKSKGASELEDEVDSDEDEEGGLHLPSGDQSQQSRTDTPVAGRQPVLPSTSGTSNTSSLPLHADHNDEDSTKMDTLVDRTEDINHPYNPRHAATRRWHSELGASRAEQDALGKKLAGSYLIVLSERN